MKKAIGFILLLTTIFIFISIVFQNESNALFRVKHGYGVAGCSDATSPLQGPASGSKATLDEHGVVVGATTWCSNMESWCLRRVCEVDGVYYEANEGIIQPEWPPPIQASFYDPPIL